MVFPQVLSDTCDVMGVYMRAGTDRLRGFADVFSIFDDLCSLRDVLQRNFMIGEAVIECAIPYITATFLINYLSEAAQTVIVSPS